jgi:hypothetical protein
VDAVFARGDIPMRKPVAISTLRIATIPAAAIALTRGAPRPPKPKPLPTLSRKDAFPLGTVPNACPDFGDYAKGGIANWRDFMATASLVRSVLGISPSAWDDALEGDGRDSGRDPHRLHVLPR